MNEDDIIRMGHEADDYANCEWDTEAPAHDWKQHRDTHFARLVAASAQPATQKLWLWKNFVDGRPEYWAFDNAYPVNMDGGDPQTLGDPCGYALFKPSINGRTDVSDAQVLKRITANAKPVQPTELTEAEIDAGIMALLQCSESDLESLSPKMYEWYADDVRLRNQYNRGR